MQKPSTRIVNPPAADSTKDSCISPPRQLFPLHVTKEHEAILRKINSKDPSEQKQALEAVGVTFRTEGGKNTLTFRSTDEGHPLSDKSDFKQGEDAQGHFTIRTVAEHKDRKTTITKMPVEWNGDTRLPLEVIFNPSNDVAAKIIICQTINEELVTREIPIDGVGQPKPLGRMRGSSEGGIAEGEHCQKNAFNRQVQLAVALAASASLSDMSRLIADRRPIDRDLHDRAMDGWQDFAIISGQVSNPWEYAANLESIRPQGPLKGRLIEYVRIHGQLPLGYFQKLVGNNSSQISGGKLSANQIHERLELIGDEALLKITNSKDLAATLCALQPSREIVRPHTREIEQQEVRRGPASVHLTI